MSYTVEKLENNQVKFDYVVSAEDFGKAIDAVYVKTRNKYNVPGFRKGHAPKKVIEGMYGVGVFFNDAINKLIDDSIDELANSSEYEFVAVDSVNDVDMTDDGGVKYSVVMIAKPEVKLGQYKGLDVKKEAVKVTAKEVDEYIAKEQEKQARFVDVEAAAENGNTVLLDYVGTVDGVAFEGGSAEDYELALGSNTFIPGFEEQLVGVKAGEKKDVKVTFPTEYHAEQLAGKEAVFACNVKAVRVKELPALDDEFVKEVSEFDTLAEYKADVKDKLTKDAEHKAEHDYEDALVEKIVEGSEVNIPQVMIDREAEDMVHDLEHRISHYGMRFDDYLKYMNTTKEKLAEDYKEQAAKSVKVRLVMEAIVKEENIGIEEKELDERIEKLAEENSQTVEEFKKHLSHDYINYIVNSIVSEKLMNVIKSDGVAKAAPKKTAAKTEAVEGQAEEAVEKKAPAKKAPAKKAAAADGEKAAEKKPAPKKSAKSAETKPADAE